MKNKNRSPSKELLLTMKFLNMKKNKRRKEVIEKYFKENGSEWIKIN